jgi:hypothetical protein
MEPFYFHAKHAEEKAIKAVLLHRRILIRDGDGCVETR